MEIKIHNVGHGSFISTVSDYGIVAMWDCGRSDDCRPSEWVADHGIETIHHFIVTNYDEDHIRDLCDLRSSVRIERLMRNKTITPEDLETLKESQPGGVTEAMKCLLDMMRSYTQPSYASAIQSMNPAYFYNQYKEDFDDTNNISLVTFIDCGDQRFILPGDLEVDGWKKLLENQAFVDRLTNVNIFVASHHGRKSGYCPEVFDHCTPDVVVFSDGAIEYGTQEQMTRIYGQHVRGIWFRGHTRYVLTTRGDGTITGDGYRLE